MTETVVEQLPSWATEKYRPWARFLREIEPMTEGDLREAVAQLDRETREALAEGPVQHRYSCRVCDAFGANFYKSDTFTADDPRWLVFGYHEVPKLRMRHRNDQWYGPLATEVYERCQAIYKAARAIDPEGGEQ